jgi:hypothetical protein
MGQPVELQLGLRRPHLGRRRPMGLLGSEHLPLQLRSLNDGKELPRFDAVALVHQHLLQVTRHLGVEPGLLVGRHVAGELDGAHNVSTSRLGDLYRGRRQRDDGRIEGRGLSPALPTRHHSPTQQKGAEW